jgi:para-nitrobenzyl esterase
MRRILLGLALGVSLICGVGAEAAATPDITIAQGNLAGTHEDGIAVFRGIPFAAPPVGRLRWRPPQQAPHWAGTRQATKFGAICPQTPYDVAKYFKQSEDCLTLNVWSPDTHAKLPVMVWIYGGGFRGGASAFPYYDGTGLAHHGVVVVSFNYRLGWLGFFDHPALAKENAGDATGNYGLMDQIAALKWVQANIGKFGGDPSNVTIFGESAGGMSVNDLMVSPKARGLFEKAIAESGLGLNPIATREQAEVAAVKFAARFKIKGTDEDTLAALRKLPVPEILAAQKGVPLDKATTPMVDGKIITAQPSVLFAQGKIAKAAYLAGSNSNEASLMKWLSLTTKSILGGFGKKLPAVRRLYAADGISSDNVLARQIFDDDIFAAGAHGLAHFAVRAGTPAYVYHFAYVPTAERATVKGVGHGREIPFVFGLDGYGAIPKLAAQVQKETTANDRAMIAMVQTYWTNFARTGDPNGKGPNGKDLPHWPAVTTKANHTLIFKDDTKAVAGFHARRLGLAYQLWSKQTGMPAP